MRLNGLLIVLLLASGCATTAPAPSRPIVQAPRMAVPAVATSLAFDPPVQSRIPASLLWRDVREPAAFAGFQELDVEYYNLRTDDDQIFNDGNSTFERDATSVRVGVTYH